MGLEVAERTSWSEPAQQTDQAGVPASTCCPVQLAPALPDYLVRYYRWAYLWRSSVWFFDHQPIINAILFGNYQKVMDATLRLMRHEDAGRTLQIAAVYGELTPKLAHRIDDLHVIDVASIQLRAAARKLKDRGLQAELGLMSSEHLTYGDDSFDTALMFLLLHEQPREARQRGLREALRVLRPGGRLVIAEYGEVGRAHSFHRFTPFRWVLTTAEPFLDGFWRESLEGVLSECACGLGKRVEREEQVDIFGGFYRVVSFRVDPADVDRGQGPCRGRAASTSSGDTIEAIPA